MTISCSQASMPWHWGPRKLIIFQWSKRIRRQQELTWPIFAIIIGAQKSKYCFYINLFINLLHVSDYKYMQDKQVAIKSVIKKSPTWSCWQELYHGNGVRMIVMRLLPGMMHDNPPHDIHWRTWVWLEQSFFQCILMHSTGGSIASIQCGWWCIREE